MQLCKERVDKFARVQTEQSIRLGYWMDWDRDEDWSQAAGRAAQLLHDVGGEQLHHLELPQEVPRARPGLPRLRRHAVVSALRGRPQPDGDGRGLSARRPSRRLRPVPAARPSQDENLLVWTTTPWTLTSNVAAAVNPELTYLKVRHRDQIYYLAKGALTARRLEEEFKRKEWVEGVPKLKTLEQIFKEKGGFEVVGEVTGADMVGWAYDGPFDELPAQGHPGGLPGGDRRRGAQAAAGRRRSRRGRVHRVIAWKDVGETKAPASSTSRRAAARKTSSSARRRSLPPVAPLDEDGVFVPGFGELEGKSAVDPATTDWILGQPAEKGVLLAVEKYPHSYPHCWRCKTELLFRLVDEWFIDMKWRDEIMRICQRRRPVPAGVDQRQGRELDWLRNMGDWMISKKRFWGLALPIWVCERCDVSR